MKLSELIKKCNEIYPDKDPEIKIVGDGFQEIDEALPRSSYRDESFFGTVFEKGDFICIEIKR